jgi:uncharacterized membrane protein
MVAFDLLFSMMMLNEELIQYGVTVIAVAIEVLGVVAIVLGGLFTGIRFMTNRREAQAYADFRSGLGRSILLGLELLVGADIIRTVAVDPTYESLGLLGLIVLIRTFLSFSLEVEINGHWPWQGSGWKEHKS